ncbi:CDP-diacylglycerol--glycerol-3-phosphate 3-phosphatidyltransferase [Schaalia vaccimaxillae]|uniref:CDP-diacylglycerol--glycerol-3-phosphate 3-phosphatidyltransferase n=1 Tax=Schaalia vaccimaxillae TaxID=183916 RepID=UPI0003B6B84B|nr:CDP-diacylglycerol--glycerol-3-phosphate 3-phosphatidyltransferase [Schaalia vaccimaxillae]
MDENVSALERKPKVSPVNLPNALTVLRLVLVPIFIWLKFQPEWSLQWIAFGVFAIAAMTDRLDGQIARARGLVTDFGRIADPIADKALTLGAFAMLSWEGILPWWLTILIAVRELGITVWRGFLLRRGIVVAANSGGKLKTVLQIFALGTLLVPWGHFVAMDESNLSWAVMFEYLGLALAGAALAVTLWSGFVYVLEGMRLWRVGPVKDQAELEQAVVAEEKEAEEEASAVAEDGLVSQAPLLEEAVLPDVLGKRQEH